MKFKNAEYSLIFYFLHYLLDDDVSHKEMVGLPDYISGFNF
jgi:hypothetical protein